MPNEAKNLMLNVLSFLMLYNMIKGKAIQNLASFCKILENQRKQQSKRKHDKIKQNKA